MKIKNIQITSSSTLNLDVNIEKTICVICGGHSEIVLDLVRELIGDNGWKNQLDSFDEGHFVIHSDIELDNKNYQICYIRNAEGVGENRIAANFVPNSLEYSKEDTVEFVKKCCERNKDSSNIICELTHNINKEDDRPVFVYNIGKIDDISVGAFLNSLADSGRQVLISSTLGCPKINGNNVQIININNA